MKSFYFQNKITGELVTYEEAKKEFYRIERFWNESLDDEFIETDMLSDEEIEFPDFSKYF